MLAACQHRIVDVLTRPRPRVLQVCAVDFTAYHLLRPLLIACRDEGWIAEFACAEGPGAAALRAEGFHHREIPVTRSLSPRQAIATGVLAASLLRDRPNLVHTHTPIGGLVGRAAAFAARVPAVHTFHGLPLRDPLKPTRLERAFLATERLIAQRTRWFFSQAQGDVEHAVALRIATRERVTVIGNGVDLARFSPSDGRRSAARRDLGIPDEALVVMTVSRLVREKGLLELADAAYMLAANPRLHVVVAGAALPTDRTDVSQALQEHAVSRALGTRWHQLGQRQDIAEIIHAADIFVLASHREGLPRSVIEAMAAGLPIVASDIPACRELVEPGGNGMLVAVGDAYALAQGIGSLCAAPDVRKRYGRRSREIALERHDERDVLERELAVLRRLVYA